MVTLFLGYCFCFSFQQVWTDGDSGQMEIMQDVIESTARGNSKLPTHSSLTHQCTKLFYLKTKKYTFMQKTHLATPEHYRNQLLLHTHAQKLCPVHWSSEQERYCTDTASAFLRVTLQTYAKPVFKGRAEKDNAHLNCQPMSSFGIPGSHCFGHCSLGVCNTVAFQKQTLQNSQQDWMENYFTPSPHPQ